MLETRFLCKGLKTHRAILCPVEECRLVAFPLQDARQSGEVVHRGGRQEERLDEHRYRRQDAGHAVYRLAAVAVTVFKGGALADERVDAGGIALIAAILQGLVQGSDILTPEALDNEDYHVLPSQTS